MIDEDVKECSRKAIEARERALRVGDEAHKAEWLRIADSWEKVAREYAKARLGASSADSDSTGAKADEPPRHG